MELSELKGHSWEYEEAIAARVSREESQSGESCREKAAEICTGFLSSLQLHASMWRNYLQPEKEPLERIRGNNLQHLHGTNNSTSSHHPEWGKKICSWWNIKQSAPKYIAPVVGKISLKINAPQILSYKA